MAEPLATGQTIEGSGHKIRVLMVVKALNIGGAERLIVSTAGHLDTSRFDVEAAYVLRRHDALVGELRRTGCRVHCLGVDNGLDPRWLYRLRRLLIDGDYDIVHIHSPLVAGVTRLLRTTLPRRRPRLIVTEHITWWGIKWPTRLLAGLTSPADDARIAVSMDTFESLPERMRRGTQVIIQGVDVTELGKVKHERASARAELAVADDEILIVNVANFRRQKDHDTLLRAARIVLDRSEKARFVAIGSGELADEVAALHRRLGLGERFQILGFRADAVRLMAGSDIFVLSSDHEGYPVAVMEALAIGLPVIGTAVGGVPEAVRQGVEGFVVPPHRPEELAEAILKVVVDADLRLVMGVAATGRSRRYDIRRAVASLEAIYLDLAGRR